MVAIKKIKSKNMSDVLKSCLETVREKWEKTLASTLKWALHPTKEDAVSELARSELVFLMLIYSLANLDAEMSVILLKEVDRWSLFPRITNYMSGKLEAEWKVSKEILDRAAKFAIILERSGMFTVPKELHCFLAELLSEIATAGSKDVSSCHDQSKLPGNNSHKICSSQQGDESSASGQATAEKPSQVSRKILVAKRLIHKQEGQGQLIKEKQISQNQQGTLTSTQTAHCSPTGSTMNVQLTPMASSLEPLNRPPTGAIPKILKIISTSCQTEDHQISEAVEVVTTACQTSPRMTRVKAQKKLWEGVEMDDGLLIREAVLSGAELKEARAVDWMTPLILAAREGRERALRALLDLGAEMERTGGGWQETALHWASWEGHVTVVRELLAAGANIGAISWDKATPLHYASERGYVNTVRVLVEAGARLNARDRRRRTPLILALKTGNTSVINYLRSAIENRYN